MSAKGLYAPEIIQGIPEETSSPAARAERSGSSKCLSKFGHRNPWLGEGDKREHWTDSCKNKDSFALNSALNSAQFLLLFYHPDKILTHVDNLLKVRAFQLPLLVLGFPKINYMKCHACTRGVFLMQILIHW